MKVSLESHASGKTSFKEGNNKRNTFSENHKQIAKEEVVNQSQHKTFRNI